MKKVFLIDGKTYNSLEEVPEEKRSHVQKFLEENDGELFKDPNSQVIRINGETYRSFEEIPEQYRSAVKTSIEEGFKGAVGLNNGLLKWIIALLGVSLIVIMFISLFLTRRID